MIFRKKPEPTPPTPKWMNPGKWTVGTISASDSSRIWVGICREAYKAEPDKYHQWPPISQNDPEFERKLDAALRQAERRCGVLNQWSEFRLEAPDLETTNPCAECGEPSVKGGYLCAKCEADA